MLRPFAAPRARLPRRAKPRPAPQRRKTFQVYIVASAMRRLHVGTTDDLVRRLYEHKNGLLPGFTADYRVCNLVYAEEVSSHAAATARERQVRHWTRAKKAALIEGANPGWADLAAGWFEEWA